MNERIYISDANGNIINDPDSKEGLRWATGLNFSTYWPKGYGGASFMVRRDIAARWAVKNAYDLKIRDGQRIVYQGRLNGLERSLRSRNQTVNVNADGWYAVLAERLLRKRWVDNAVVRRLYWPSGRLTATDQNELISEKRERMIRVAAAYGDITRAGNEEYHEEYDSPTGTYIWKLTLDYAMRSGEGVVIEFWNATAGATEGNVATDTGAVVSGSSTVTITQSAVTETVEFRFKTTLADIYDEHDWMQLDNVAAYYKYNASNAAAGSEAYTGAEIVEDVLLELASAEISGDYDGLTDPGFAIIPFTTLNDAPETGDSIIQRVLSFGDNSQNTYGFSIWDEFGTSDNLPKAEIVQQPATTDYEYQVALADLGAFSDGVDIDNVFNYIFVKYTNFDDQDVWLTPDDQATLTDSTSTTNYGERHKVFDVGKSDAAEALEYGERFLANNKDPVPKTSLSVRGKIRNKAGIWVNASQVRAGKRIKIMDYEGGKIFLINETHYNAETGELRMVSGLPPNNLAVMMAQREFER